MTSTILSVVSTECFVAQPAGLRQVVRASLSEPQPAGQAAVIEVMGRGVAGRAEVAAGAQRVDVAVEAAGSPGDRVPVRAGLLVEGAEVASVAGEIVVAEPGWTVHMVSHFHYDPVWWNTQGAYTSGWDFLTDDGLTRPLFENNGFALVQAHVDMALRDPDYRFVLAELDYLKPFWDTCPRYRPAVRRLLAEGRLELMGGTYNEPNTNLTGSETTIRNIVYGVGYQRDILGGDPRTGWQLDVFGHDPQFPGLLAAAGLSSSSWARGPFHQWGPAQGLPEGVQGDASRMQFAADFEWISPSGLGVLTHYMPNHYSSGWWMDAAPSLQAAEDAVYELFLSAKQVAATRNTLLPVGTDYTPPNLWVTEIHRDWNARYAWPRFVCSTPKEYFAAVRAELEAEGRRASPQSRDMNPVYTGKDVSFIDTKQAQRAAEVATTDAERLATLACVLADGDYPERALDKVWRQLAYGAHHDAITGTESDQVYLDLLAGWREAHDLAQGITEQSLARLLTRISPVDEGIGVTVFNTLSFTRSAVVEADILLERPAWGVRLVDDDGHAVAFQFVGPPPAAPTRNMKVRFVAEDVAGIGWRTWSVHPDARAVEEPSRQWSVTGNAEPRITNEALEVTVDPLRGGCLVSVLHRPTGRELLRQGEVGNELRVYEEYPAHPRSGEGPWHLVPSGPWTASSSAPVRAHRVEQSPLGQRIVVESEVGEVCYEQTVTLWHGSDVVDCTTRVVSYDGADRLVRLRVPAAVGGGLPVSEVAGAVIGRGFGLPELDAAVHPWTLDNPAQTWFALGSTAKVTVNYGGGVAPTRRAVGIVEVVTDDAETHAGEVRDLVVALARRGVTATTSRASHPRYGWLDVDSNLPDARLLVGGPDVNPVTADLLDRVDAGYQRLLDDHLAREGSAVLWVAAERPLRDSWVPSADLRDLRSLPAVIVAGAGDAELTAALGRLGDELAADAGIHAVAPAPTAPDEAEDLDDFTVALLTEGTPGFAVDPQGGLNVSLLRSCSGWPSGIWIDPPKRSAPDGSDFQLQHWTHEFHYGLVVSAGDWRAADLPRRGQAWSSPLYARQQPAVVEEPTLGRTEAALTVEPSDRVMVQAVKPAGNPSATGRQEQPEPSEGVTVRLVELHGGPATARVGGLLEWEDGRRATLLEEPTGDELRESDGVVETTLAGSEIATVILTPAARTPPPARVALGPQREVTRPNYARYWLHNRGPAPMGFLPVAVSVEETSVVVRSEHTDLRITVASHLVADRAEGTLRVHAPRGWSVQPEERIFSLAPGGHTDFRVRVHVPQSPAPGLYHVAVVAEVGGEAIEDVASFAVPGTSEPASPSGGLSLLPQRHQTDSVPDPIKVKGTTLETGRDLGCDVDLGAGRGPGAAVVVHPRGTARLVATITNRTASPLRGELQMVSPWGTWDMVGPASRAVEVAPGATIEVVTTVSCPPGTAPGRWWVLAKWMWFGRVQYTNAVGLVVEDPCP